MVTHSPPTSEFGGSNPGSYVGKVGSCLPMVLQFAVQNLDQLYVLVSSAHKNYKSCYDLYSVENDIKPQINKLQVILKIV